MTDTITVPEPQGSEATQRENAERGFVAPESLTKNLQNVLVDFIALSLVAKQLEQQAWFISAETRTPK